ncbi:MAG: HNH endonuclease signature motif containing protein [Pseudomonadota bacterium]
MTDPDLILYVRECFDYEPDTGRLIWRERPASHFVNKGAQVRCNKAYAGTEAGTICKTSGYRVTSIKGKSITVHRVVWLLQTGSWPADQIDHIDRDKANNRWENLRAVDQLTNQKNRPISRNNKSGKTGASWSPKNNRWRASICANGRRVYLGLHKNKADAIAARVAAEKQYGFVGDKGVLNA